METAHMSGWLSVLIVILAGALGGIVNALISDNGFILPKPVPGTASAGAIWRPGFVGNILIGAVAALVSWALYSSAAGLPVIAKADVNLTWAGFASAVLVGIGGSRWLTAEVDKKLLRATAAEAADKDKNSTLSTQMALLSPADALQMVRKS